MFDTKLDVTFSFKKDNASPGLAGGNSSTHQGRIMPRDFSLAGFSIYSKNYCVVLIRQARVCEIRAMF